MADNNTTNESSPVTSTAGSVPSSSGAESQNTSINQMNSNVSGQSNIHQQAQYNNSNSSYYGNNYGNTNYNSNKLYNKHYNSNRQGYSNSTNNRQHYNSRKNYNNQKMSHHSNQYSNYSNYPANMYAYGYYPSPYGYPTPIVPGITPIPGYPPQQPFGSLPTGGRIKITDKEGKQIDLEEKKKLSNASNTPISSPSQSIASPVSSLLSPVAPSATTAGEDKPSSKDSTTTTASSAAVSTASSATNQTPASNVAAKSSVAEEFKRKILERAAKAAQKSESKSEEKAKAAAATKLAPETKKDGVKEQPNEVKEQAVESKEESKDELKEVSKEQPKEQPTEEPKEEHKEEPKEEPKEEHKEEPKEEPKEESKEESREESKEEQKEQKEQRDEVIVSSSVVEVETPKESPVEEPAQIEKDESESKPTESPEISEETTTEQAPEPKEEEPSFQLSQFFDRLKTAKEIEDPFAVTYPSPFVGVDTSRKLESKKYRYDPQFLMQFRDVIQYPIDNEWKTKLESLGIVANVKRSPGSQSSRNLNKFGNSISGRFGSQLTSRNQFGEGRQGSRSGSKRRGGSGSSRDKSTRKGTPSKRGGRDRDNKEKDDESKPVEEVKPLEKSANRWVPRSRAKKTETKLAPDGTEILEPEEIERKVNSLLNKLTLEMFDPITDDILKLADQSKWEDDAKTVRQIISLTFAKACDEPYWSSMYAQFCAKMCTSISDEVKDNSIVLKNTGKPATGGDLARRILLTTCQAEYEKGWTDKLPTNPDGTPLEPEMMSDEYYIMAAAKRRGLGLVKFIGHLYILGMLNDQVILLCLRDQSKNTVDPSEDSLENLAQLVKTVGAKLETTEKNRTVLNLVFDNIQTILDNCKLSSRIKFMLMDLQDLRASKWALAKSEAGPKTIQEIHNEAELKRLEEEKANAERRRKNRSNEPRSNSSRTGSSWGNNSQSKRNEPRIPMKGDTFTPVQSRSQSNRPTNVSASDSSSQRDNSKRTESMQSNMFAALGDGDDDENNDDEATTEHIDKPAEIDQNEQ